MRSDTNSTKSRAIKSNFVKNNVKADMTPMIKSMLVHTLYGNDSVFTDEEYEKSYSTLDNSYTDAEHRDNPVYLEPLEWWVVSPYLGEKLKEQDEIVISDGMNEYWGRTTNGQDIYLDSVIDVICLNIGILEGQETDLY